MKMFGETKILFIKLNNKFLKIKYENIDLKNTLYKKIAQDFYDNLIMIIKEEGIKV